MPFIKRAIFPLFIIDLLFIALILAKPSKSDPKKDANLIYQSCSNFTYKEQCYAKEFYDLTKKTNLEYATFVLSSLQEIDPKNSLGCHFIAHRISVAETEKNPSKWQDVLRRIKVASCTGGFLHGVMEARFEKDPKFRITGETVDLICNKILNDKSFGERSCDHIMGHLLMVENAGLIDRSVKECDKLKNEAVSYECLSGVFMENLTREDLVSHGLSQPLAWTLENTLKIEKLCNEYNGLAQRACWREISYMYAAIDGYVPSDLFSSCNRAPDETSRTGCYIYGIGNAVNFPGFEQKNLSSACSVYSSKDSRYILCVFQIVGSLIASSEKNLGKALDICKNVGPEFKPSCYGFLLDTLKKDKVSSGTFKNTCLKIPVNFKMGKC